jgi:hypothetical protein
MYQITGPSTTDVLPADVFLRTVVDEVTALHGELLQLMREVPLVDFQPDGSPEVGITLDPASRQQHASAVLMQRFRAWFDRVRPFLDRSPTAPTNEFDEAFEVLSSYFALRRIGSGIAQKTWRELFELESAHFVGLLLGLLMESSECFALLNPRPARQMEDLVIRFAPIGDRRYMVFAESSRGDAQAEMKLPFEPRDVENFVLRHCDPARGAVRGWAPPSVQPYAAFGEQLFHTLFTGAVRDLFQQHAGAMAAGDVGLRIRLRMASVPELAAIPWEYLYDGTEFLALTGAVTLMRHVEASKPIRPLAVDGPLRIAVTVSAPTDRATIDAKAEIEGLKTALAPLVSAGLVRIDVAPDGTIATLAAMLNSAASSGHPFHVWHFIGHGRHSEREGVTYLVFENANGTPRLVSGFELGTLLAPHAALRIAILNACEGARAAPEDSLTSVGAAIVARGTPAAVAMQFSITDAAAIRFADDFYRALADRGSIDAAVADARRSIFFMPNESEWATPVVLSRASDGVLFDLRRAAE